MVVKIIIIVLVGGGLTALVSWLAIDLIKQLKKRHDLKHGKQPKEKKQKDLDW